MIYMQVSVRNMRLVLMGMALTMAMLPALVSANNECSFGRTLDVGVEGEDVRCLQQYLNARGFTIATEGPGSVGSETTQFGGLTEAAVLRWQERQNVVGANGVFGPASQAAYLLDVVNTLENQVASGVVPVTVSTVATPQVAGATTVSEVTLVASFIAALEAIELADDEVEHRILTGEDYSDHMRSLNKAKRDFFAATTEYFTGSKSSAYSLLNGVISMAEDAADESAEKSSVTKDEDRDDEDNVNQSNSSNLSVVEKRRNAWNNIDDMWDQYEDVKDEIEKADDDDEDVEDAEDYLDEAGDAIEDAEDAANDGDFDEVEDLLDDAEALLQDAEDEL